MDDLRVVLFERSFTFNLNQVVEQALNVTSQTVTEFFDGLPRLHQLLDLLSSEMVLCLARCGQNLLPDLNHAQRETQRKVDEENG